MMDLLLLLLHVLLQILLLPSPTDMETLNLVMPNKGAYTNACRKVACTVTNQKNALAISTETSASSLSSNSNGNIAADRMTLTVHNAMADTCRRNLLLGKLNIQMVLRPTILALGTNIARMRGKDVMDGRTTAGRGTAACGMYVRTYVKTVLRLRGLCMRPAGRNPRSWPTIVRNPPLTWHAAQRTTQSDFNRRMDRHPSASLAQTTRPGLLSQQRKTLHLWSSLLCTSHVFPQQPLTEFFTSGIRSFTGIR